MNLKSTHINIHGLENGAEDRMLTSLGQGQEGSQSHGGSGKPCCLGSWKQWTVLWSSAPMMWSFCPSSQPCLPFSQDWEFPGKGWMGLVWVPFPLTQRSRHVQWSYPAWLVFKEETTKNGLSFGDLLKIQNLVGRILHILFVLICMYVQVTHNNLTCEWKFVKVYRWC